jgi:hypothetical protein
MRSEALAMAIPKIKRTEKKCKVKATGDVALSLSLFIGEGQFGRSDVVLEDQHMVRVTGDIIELRLGPAADLKGKTLLINTLGVDVNSDTNRLRVDYELTGVESNAQFFASDKVDNDNESVLFLTKVLFT